MVYMVFQDIYWWLIPSASLLSLLLCYMIIIMMKSMNMVTQTNERTSHFQPIPYGGGWVVGFFIMVGIIIDFAHLPHFYKFFIGFLLIFFISAIDDAKKLPWILRLIIHYIACSFALAFASKNTGFEDSLMPLINIIGYEAFNGLITLGWLLYINFTNFIDGLDGISTQNSLLISLSMAIMLFFMPPLNMPGFDGITIALLIAAMVGFGFFNRHPAILFLGDSGAIGLGFLHGVCLMCLWGSGYWQHALILATFPIVESSYTLLNRLKNGQKIWESYRDYSFHLLAPKGSNHRQATKYILLLHVIIFLCFLSGFIVDFIGIVCAYACTLFYHYYVRKHCR